MSEIQHTPEALEQILALHKLWLKADPAGKQANLSKANLSRASLSGANLSRASLSGADLSKANLSWANLSRANLSRASLSGADLSGANLFGANLSWANLSRADLSAANLSRASLYKANLYGAKLNWSSPWLIGHLLMSHAGQVAERRAVAGLVAQSWDWCHAQFEPLVSADFLGQAQWVRETLAPWADDRMPNYLRVMQPA